MQICSRYKKTPLLIFVVSPELTKIDPLLWKQLIFPMGYNRIYLPFLMTIDTVIDITNNSCIDCDEEYYHPLYTEADTPPTYADDEVAGIFSED